MYCVKPNPNPNPNPSFKPNQSFHILIQVSFLLFCKCDIQHFFRNVNNSCIFETSICNVSEVSRNVHFQHFFLVIGLYDVL